jgi:hypothetical protein
VSLTCVQLCAAYIHSTQYINSPDESNKLSTGIGHIIVLNTSDSESDNQPFSNNNIQKSKYNEETNWISNNINSPLVCRSPVSPTLCRVCLRHRHKGDTGSVPVSNDEAAEASSESNNNTPSTSTPAAEAESTLSETQQSVAVVDAENGNGGENGNENDDDNNNHNNATHAHALEEAIEKVKTLLDKKMQFQKEESMHPAVITALEAYCLVMRSLSKTPQMCESALECVCILVNHGYISGARLARKIRIEMPMPLPLIQQL